MLETIVNCTFNRNSSKMIVFFLPHRSSTTRGAERRLHSQLTTVQYVGPNPYSLFTIHYSLQPTTDHDHYSVPSYYQHIHSHCQQKMASNHLLLLSCALLCNSLLIVGFTPTPAFIRHFTPGNLQDRIRKPSRGPLRVGIPSFFIALGDDDEEDDNGELEEDEEDDDDEEEEEDPYTKVAKSEFQYENKSSSSALTQLNGKLDATVMDWGGALGKLRERVSDMESGESKNPSHVLFRLMSSQSPNQVIGQFVNSANPQTVQAMSGAVGSLLGGLTNPSMGVETIVKASGEKIGSLCFQLQMTGYMFRNAEYVLALKDLMNLQGKATMEEYREAFNRLDKDKSGYIESSEIQELFDDVYDGQAPSFEIDAFMKFFDKNNDGRINWEEFESGLGVAMATQLQKGSAAKRILQGEEDYDDDDDDEEDDEIIDVSTNVSGTIEIEMEDGKNVKVEAKEYIESLKAEARALKEALRREKQGNGMERNGSAGLIPDGGNGGGNMDIATYIASRQGDVKSLTEGISPEVVDTMKRLVKFVLEGSDGKTKAELTDEQKAQMEMEIPGSALQQLSLWQLVLGYRLREAEVTGEYMKLLE